MKLNERYFYCFGCGATGDVIDFVARLFGLNSYEAVSYTHLGPATQKHLLAVLAQAQGLVTVYQHEAEHHLDAQQQRMEIPIAVSYTHLITSEIGKNICVLPQTTFSNRVEKS